MHLKRISTFNSNIKRACHVLDILKVENLQLMFIYHELNMNLQKTCIPFTHHMHVEHEVSRVIVQAERAAHTMTQ